MILLINSTKSDYKYNAQLSGEQRTDQVAALHRKTLYSTHSKTATR
ncbi:hypothetical protein VAE128_490082 [Vibrio aestuarianus]|nr:hypothetical protein VAE128_490082 [Vibrio aestuarianus]